MMFEPLSSENPSAIYTFWGKLTGLKTLRFFEQILSLSPKGFRNLSWNKHPIFAGGYIEKSGENSRCFFLNYNGKARFSYKQLHIELGELWDICNRQA